MIERKGRLAMYIKDKQKLISKSLFKKLQTSVRSKNQRTDDTLDTVVSEVLSGYKKNVEFQSLSKEEKEKLHTYLQIAFSEPI